jgi:hypothetical protein
MHSTPADGVSAMPGSNRALPRIGMMNNFETGALARPISDQQPVKSARMVIRILFVSWAVFLLASQLICGCATFLHWLSAG